jgi:biopolymer transport protein ExbB
MLSSASFTGIGRFFGSYTKFRPLLLALVMVAALCTATTVFAQTAAPAAGAPGDTAPAAEAKTEGVFVLVIHHADFITFTILALSIVGLTLILQGFMRNRVSVFMPESSTNTIRELITQRKFKELIEFTETDTSFVSKALNPALKRAPSFTPMKEAMETAIGEQTAEQFRAIEYLNIIGNLGPLLGLLGTVLGMIEAFQQMQGAGGADPGKLGAGIATALSHTFMGLFLAVPCLACFGVLRTIVDRLTVRGALVAEELLLMMKPQEKTVATPAAAARPGATPQPARKIPAPLPAPGAGAAPAPVG